MSLIQLLLLDRNYTIEQESIFLMNKPAEKNDEKK